ncbi:DNA topoisomerase [Bifidobacterium moukalabense]
MNSRHGLTAEQTLAALQHLYEMNAATYPRTDSSLPLHHAHALEHVEGG